MIEVVLVLVVAFVLDLAFGDPVYPWHPIRLIGRLVEVCERRLRAAEVDDWFAAWLMPGGCVAASLFCYFALLAIIPESLEFLLNVFLVYSLIALRDLQRHGVRVAQAVAAGDLVGARRFVGMMVGRDTSGLDEAGVCRAAIESVAENFVDGFLSPVFWYFIGCWAAAGGATGGVAMLVVFKVISTLDSMIGYRNDKYLVFGRVSAIADDVMNFVPARLSIPLLALAAAVSGLDWRACLRIGMRDRLRHASPNSAHGEAAMAGALNLRLGGAAIYHGRLTEKPWLGEGRAAAAAADVDRALLLTRNAGVSAVIMSILLLLMIS